MVIFAAVLVGLGIYSLLNDTDFVQRFSVSTKPTTILSTGIVPITGTETSLVEIPSASESLIALSPSPSASTKPTATFLETKLPTITFTDVFTLTSLPISTSISIPAMGTTAFSQTPSQENQPYTPGPLFQTPFGPQHAYVLHHIREGESLPIIADLYRTDIDVVLSLNAWISELGFRANLVIIVMPGQRNSLQVEPLSVGYTKEEITVVEFAEYHGVTVKDVRFYNDLGVSENIPAGRYLIYPYKAATLTPSPTSIPTPDLSKALTEPFGPDNKYIVHRVAIGESLPLLETRYLTTADVIRATNVMIGSLQEGQLLLIMPGQTETIDTPKLSTSLVSETISIEALASEIGVLYADLVYYNNLTQGQDIPAGRWIIYPSLDEK